MNVILIVPFDPSSATASVTFPATSCAAAAASSAPSARAAPEWLPFLQQHLLSRLLSLSFPVSQLKHVVGVHVPVPQEQKQM